MHHGMREVISVNIT